MSTTTASSLEKSVLVDPEFRQQFGKDPVKRRESGNFVQEYVQSFVEKWDDLIDWDRRAESEGDFFIRVLKERGAKKILDVATGTGFHSVRLKEAGFEVISADGSPQMLAKAFDNARERGHILRSVLADWRWLNRDVHGKYDAVICLGNSFTHLFKEHDRRKALAEFYAALKHDGVLILDQRNYDEILDHGFSSKHQFYYCGGDVVAEPEHVDEGLARFRYAFPDGAEYHLNMFPLRKDYTVRLMHEVGFQQIATYGDFQEEDDSDDSPDFYIHVAGKSYSENPDVFVRGSREISRADRLRRKESKGARDRQVSNESYSPAVETARNYYNSDDADNFYYHVWGGEDIHIGLYESRDESIRDASRRTVEQMVAKYDTLDPSMRMLDIGGGYGGAMRHLAQARGCRSVVLNISEKENERDRQMNDEQGVDHLIEVIDGDFAKIPFGDESFEGVWSQDAILHSDKRPKVLAEVARVLKRGGSFVFTDPMHADDAPVGKLQPIYDRIHLESLASPSFYRGVAEDLGLEVVEFDERQAMLAHHYTRVLETLKALEADMLAKRLISERYVKRMKKGLQHWIDGGNAGHLTWGIFHLRKPE